MVAALLGLTLFAQDPPFPKDPLKLSVTDVSGKVRAMPTKESKASVVVFVMTDCPIANRMAPEVARISSEYGKKGVSFLIAYVDPEASKEEIKKHLKAYGYTCPGVADPKLTLVRKMGATITPEAVVLDSKGKMVYRGRINDLYEDHGKVREKPRTNDLRDALDEVLAGKAVTNPHVPPIGCYIPIK